MRTSVHIPDELLKRAKKKAAEEGRTLTALIEEGLRTVLTEAGAVKQRRKRVELIVSEARDGVLAGIDLTNNAALQDLMDDQAIREAGLMKLR